MIKTVLFDLDDTLLGNNMDIFLPRYFALLDKFAASHLGIDGFIPPVLQASRVMTGNTDPALTNNDVFWREIEKLVGLDRVQSERILEEFYHGEFNQLRSVTETVPGAVDIVQTCFRKGCKVVIATNPMFPRPAVETRLIWAGIPAGDFPYDLLTTIENMHATKPHQEYYREILARVGCAPSEALMVGDDWRRDIEPASAAGLHSYWIQLPGKTPPDAALPSAYGSLEGLLARIESGWLHQLAVSA